MFEISSNTSDTLTLSSGDFSGEVDETFRIYQHNTLGSLFGADPESKGVVGGFAAAVADQILLFDTASGNFQTFFFKNETNPLDPKPLGWVEAGNEDDTAEDTVIPANIGFVYVRRDDASDLSVTVFGDVIDSAIAVNIIPGFNLVTVPTPVNTGVTLGNSGLAPDDPLTPADLNVHLEGSFSAATAETIFIWDGSAYKTYFFKNETNPLDPKPLGWVEAGNEDSLATDVPLEPGSFFISLKTGVGRPALDWVFPSVIPPLNP
jgi:hypothetical protein